MSPTPPLPPPVDLPWPIPKFKLRIDDLDHEGVFVFLGAIDPQEALCKAVMASFKWLYTRETVLRSVQEITLILKSMPGVAHTTGSDSQKEIYYSLDYIVDTKSRAQDEIMGVLVHEVVHCFQYNAKGSCPGGLIEGIADYVRLKAGKAPPHWHKNNIGSAWDAGYELTGYFLDWIEKRHGSGTIMKLNGLMKDVPYKDELFKELTGRSVKELWEDYCATRGCKDEVDLPTFPGGNAVQEVEELDEPLKEWPIPKFNIRVEDLGHEGADIFYDAVKPKGVLHRAVLASFNCLYTLETVPRKVKEILLVLRSMEGVAYTTGSETHKEIHLSLDYIKYAKDRALDEITGVLVHEVVHCYQHTGRDTCPGGFIEGVADFVRLKEKLGPPHWSQWPLPAKWDVGYEGTAFFLEWIDDTFGSGSVRRLNGLLKERRYEESMFEEITGPSLDDLWVAYGEFRSEEHAEHERKKGGFVIQKDES